MISRISSSSGEDVDPRIQVCRSLTYLPAKERLGKKRHAAMMARPKKRRVTFSPEEDNNESDDASRKLNGSALGDLHDPAKLTKPINTVQVRVLQSNTHASNYAIGISFCLPRPALACLIA